MNSELTEASELTEVSELNQSYSFAKVSNLWSISFLYCSF